MSDRSEADAIDALADLVAARIAAAGYATKADDASAQAASDTRARAGTPIEIYREAFGSPDASDL